MGKIKASNISIKIGHGIGEVRIKLGEDITSRKRAHLQKSLITVLASIPEIKEVYPDMCILAAYDLGTSEKVREKIKEAIKKIINVDDDDIDEKYMSLGFTPPM